MKINRDRLTWFLKQIRYYAEGKELSDEQLIDQLASYMETNPGCIDINGVSNPGRYGYSTVGYGVFSLMGERYRIGRIEIFDRQNESGYAIDEGTYCMPFIAANQFEDFMESLQTDLPIEIKIGSHSWCEEECAKDLGIDKELLNDPETKRAFYRKKNDIYAQEQGYKDFDDLLANSRFGDLRLKKDKDENA